MIKLIKFATQVLLSFIRVEMMYFIIEVLIDVLLEILSNKLFKYLPIISNSKAKKAL
jgi:hypothetical protein